METATNKRKPGPIAGEPSVKTTVLMRPYQVEWAKAQPGGLSETVRQLMDKAIVKPASGQRRELTGYGFLKGSATTTARMAESAEDDKRLEESQGF